MNDLDFTLREQASTRGLDAWKIAVALRRKHGVEGVEPEWDYVSYLQEVSAEAIRQKTYYDKKDNVLL